MHLTTRNVNTALRELLAEFHAADRGYAGAPPVERTDSRNGPVLRIAEPVVVTYNRPLERVLFNSVRDANPFSLLYEALWTLAGRNDVDPIAHYTKRMREFSDDGVTWHGAYGNRWRTHFGRDQLDDAVQRLRADSTDRRVVLEMWDARVDGVGNGKDYPCNTHTYFAVRNGALDLTVCNRSNDMIWGVLGANYAVFSFLLEYVATRTGIPVGRYHQVTNDLHVYETRPDWKPAELLAAPELVGTGSWAGSYYDGKVGQNLVPLVRNPAAFEGELPRFVEHFSGKFKADELGAEWAEPFLADVAAPLLIAWACHKEKDYHSAFGVVAECTADDWRVAAESWLRRRSTKHERRAT